MWKKTLSLFSAVILASAVQAQGCPLSGITVLDVGQGSGVYAPTRLNLLWDPASCSLEVSLDAFSCCNVYATQHHVLFGDQLLSTPVSLGRPFLSGSQLLVRRSFLSGAIPGTASNFAVPPDPALIGQTFTAQAAGLFEHAIGQELIVVPHDIIGVM